jgi:hypothetical protein
MATSRLPDQKAIILLEDNICTRELTLSWKVAEGMDVAAEEAALTEWDELYAPPRERVH